VRGSIRDVHRHHEHGEAPSCQCCWQAATVLRRACSGVRIISQKTLYTSVKSTS
jgi:hypothetical protein